MDKTTSSVDDFRQQFYDYLKQEDIDYVNAQSRKETVDLYYKRELDGNPWLQCFCFNDDESKKSPDKSLGGCAVGENNNNQNVTLISTCSSLTDEELNCCKAAMRREARSKNLPDLFGKPNEMQLFFLEYRDESPKQFLKQRLLRGKIEGELLILQAFLRDGLEALKPVSKMKITEGTTMDEAVADITKMRRMVQDFKTTTNFVIQNLSKVMKRYESYRELDEEMDSDVFTFFAHFLPNFLIPRSARKRDNTRINLDYLKVNL